MARTGQRVSPWTDWLPLHHESAMWFGPPKLHGGAALPAPGPLVNIHGATIAVDQGDVAHIAAGAGIPALFLTGRGATFKPTFTRSGAGSAGALRIVGYFRSIKIPDGVIAKQAGRLAEWDGQRGEAMADGGRRVAIQIENVLQSRVLATGVGSDLTGFGASVKFRGFGMPDATAGDEVASQDVNVAGNALGGALVNLATPALGAAWGAANETAFPDMDLPSNATTDLDAANAAPYFDSDGIARIQTIVEVPQTVMPGTYVDLIFVIQIPITAGGVAAIDVQWPYSAYRWIGGGPKASYPFMPNTTRQLDPSVMALDGHDEDEESQPYFDIESDGNPQSPA